MLLFTLPEILPLKDSFPLASLLLKMPALLEGGRWASAIHGELVFSDYFLPKVWLRSTPPKG